jgi:Protein phosphatase 2C
VSPAAGDARRGGVDDGPRRPMMKFAGMTPKRGHDTAECEDRFSSSSRRFAVADGASESGYSYVWAQILADSFCRSHASRFDPGELSAWLARCRAEWRRWADAAALGDLPWFARETLRTGAFATFIGLAFSQGEWHAVACGDACLFVVRDDRLAAAFPLADGDGFDNTPPLVATANNFGGPGNNDLRTATGIAEPGDSFYLMTDALAHWFLADHDRGEKPWIALDAVRTPRDLDLFVSASRESLALKNDDVTLMSIVIVPE